MVVLMSEYGSWLVEWFCSDVVEGFLCCVMVYA
jgi:hypothetical protein